jgi:hypothetical protein
VPIGNGQEIRPSKLYLVGEPYEILSVERKVLTFAFLSFPKRVWGTEKYAGEVVFADGMTKPILFEPSEVRERPGFFQRIAEVFTGNPLLHSCGGRSATPAASQGTVQP